MNSKKNKKHKPKPNPNPPQKAENLSTVEKAEDIVEEKPEVTIVSEERVPEIVSEVSVPPVVEAKPSEEDTPKKPKRNRGKKKKGDKEDDADDNQQHKSPEPVVEEIKLTDEPKDFKNIETPIEMSCEVPDVTPTARKKKNKQKKNIEQHFDEQTTGDKEDKNIPTTEKVRIEPENIQLEVKQETISPVPVEMEEQDTKTSKKKNKKKKRTDSERSDKAEETMTCTAAFQELLEVKDENKEAGNDIQAEDNKPPTSTSEYLGTEVKIETEILPPVEHSPYENLSDIPREEVGKGKKKNKKDKKHPPKPDQEVIPPAIGTETINNPPTSEVKILLETKTGTAEKYTTLPETTDTKSEIMSKETISEIQKVKLESPTIEREKSPKPKSKIAKPVDKKRKGKSETESIVPETSNLEFITTEEKPINVLLSLQPTEQEEKFAKEIVSPQDEVKSMEITQKKLDELIPEREEIIELLHETDDNIKIPKTAMGKKRKKSPKPPKSIETTDEVKFCKDIEYKEAIMSDEGKNEDVPISKEETPAPSFESSQPKESFQSMIEINTEKPIVKPDESTEQKIEPPRIEHLPIIPLPSETMSIPADNISITEGSLSEHKDELKPEPDSGLGKKRKKSPKLPRKFDITHEPKESVVKDSTNIDESAKEEGTEKTESPSDLPPLEDIEIRSIKTDESESSTCDIIPDVQYPRSSSEVDANNNMIIQEVTSVAAKYPKLNIPVVLPDTPFIRGSGETPITIPEFVSTGIRLTEIDAKITRPNDEKTDLKSKVMEVNKDMEDLRLSIERSLAELTAMEKSEKEVEKTMEIKAEETKETEFKQEQIEDELREIKQLELKQDTSKSQEIMEPIEKAEDNLEASSIEAKDKKIHEDKKSTEISTSLDISTPPPVHPPRKDNKGKGKSKKKGKHEGEHGAATTSAAVIVTSTIQSSSAESGSSEAKDTSQESKKEEKSEQKSQTQERGKQQSSSFEVENNTRTECKDTIDTLPTDFDPIENFEDAMTSSADDVNKTFEIIADEATPTTESQINTEIQSQNNPEISITAPTEDDEKTDKQEKENPLSQPKNLLGHPNIPARLNKTDYKKEKNKPPNERQAKVKIKDAVPIDVNKQSKESQTDNKTRFQKDGKSISETITCMTNENEEYVYKYSFRKVFLPSACHVCKKDLKQARVPCNFCNLVFYCSPKHKDEDYPKHQALCFAVSTIAHLKDQKHIYAEAKDVTGHNYRLLRMQAIVSSEKVLKRKLVPWEQEALLYPRVCTDVGCREWRQGSLRDCEGCGQISYCTDHPDHLPSSHQRWCKSYSLYQRLVSYQQTRGRLEPKLPSRVVPELCQIPENLNEVLASMYEEKIDMTDIQYAALTQIATAPLTALFCHQLYTNKMNSTYANGMHKKSSFTIHVVGAELQFEADALNKWEIFFLHLRPDLKELRVVLISPELNPSNLPLDLLGKINLCENCRQNRRRLVFEFQDKQTYHEYWSTDFTTPDLVCAFNPSIQRAAALNGKDTWPTTVKCILKLRVPFIVTSYTMTELHRDLARIKECAEIDFNVISEPKNNAFASVRPDRNFISDDEMPLLFKNYCVGVVCGAF